jgi:hypothetical protein
MDKDVRSDKPGKCPRCGMQLVLGVRDEIEYPPKLKMEPATFRVGQPVQMTFRVADPKTGKTVRHFEVMHEKLFHLFIASEDLGLFIHEHPVPQPDGAFKYETTFPKKGMYRVAADFLSGWRHATINCKDHHRARRERDGSNPCGAPAQTGTWRQPLHKH